MPFVGKAGNSLSQMAQEFNEGNTNRIITLVNGTYKELRFPKSYNSGKLNLKGANNFWMTFRDY